MKEVTSFPRSVEHDRLTTTKVPSAWDNKRGAWRTHSCRRRTGRHLSGLERETAGGELGLQRPKVYRSTEFAWPHRIQKSTS
jgi:hypothetical protein